MFAEREVSQTLTKAPFTHHPYLSKHVSLQLPETTSSLFHPSYCELLNPHQNPHLVKDGKYLSSVSQHTHTHTRMCTNAQANRQTCSRTLEFWPFWSKTCFLTPLDSCGLIRIASLRRAAFFVLLWLLFYLQSNSKLIKGTKTASLGSAKQTQEQTSFGRWFGFKTTNGAEIKGFVVSLAFLLCLHHLLSTINKTANAPLRLCMWIHPRSQERSSSWCGTDDLNRLLVGRLVLLYTQTKKEAWRV